LSTVETIINAVFIRVSLINSFFLISRDENAQHKRHYTTKGKRGKNNGSEMGETLGGAAGHCGFY